MITDQNLIDRIGGEDHVRFLAEAGEILAGSLDYETELERVARGRSRPCRLVRHRSPR